MAYALVGSMGAVAANNTPAFGQATTAGNLLIAWANAGANNTPPTGWSAALSTSASLSIFYKQNCGAGETAPTLNASVAFSRLGEFSGGNTTAPADQSGFNTSSTSPVTATNGAADAAAGELVIYLARIVLSKAGTHTTTFTLNNGATALSVVNNDATSTVEHYRYAYGITTGNAGADTLQLTSDSMNIGSGGLQCALASFTLASAAAATSDPISLVTERRTPRRRSMQRW